MTVSPGVEAERLDRFLAARGGLPSRAFGQKLIRDGLVRVNGATVRASHPVADGDTIEFTIPPPEPSLLEPEAIPLDVRYEDDDLVVVNKPPGMVVHPGAGNRTGTLVHALLALCGALEGGAPERPGIVHRLDKDTSGLLVAAKNRTAHLRLSRAIERREVERRYLAVVWGGPPDEGVIDAPVGRSRSDRTKMTVTASGKEARTRFHIRERFLYASLVEVRLESGRTHQIRVHFAHRGNPVFGDPTYSGRTKAVRGIAPERRRSAESALGRIERQALHAWRLTFRHPVSGGELTFEADPPPDFENLVTFLRAEAL